MRHTDERNFGTPVASLTLLHTGNLVCSLRSSCEWRKRRRDCHSVRTPTLASRADRHHAPVAACHHDHAHAPCPRTPASRRGHRFRKAGARAVGVTRPRVGECRTARQQTHRRGHSNGTCIRLADLSRRIGPSGCWGPVAGSGTFGISGANQLRHLCLSSTGPERNEISREESRPVTSYRTLSMVFVVVTLLVTGVSWSASERPINNLKRRFK